MKGFIMEQEIVYYYLKDEQNHPFGCVAIYENEDGTINRGISLCSTQDAFKKACARGLAFKRLNAAMNSKTSIKFAKHHDESCVRISCPIKFNSLTEFKSAYHVEPTKQEYRMLHKPAGM